MDCAGHAPACAGERCVDGLFGSSSWLYIILVGFVVGLLGRFFMPGNNRMGGPADPTTPLGL